MIPLDCLIGILFASCRNTITIVRSDQTKFGYKILLSSSIRADEPTLQAIQRTLYQQNIESKLIPKESKSYPKPILKVTKVRNLRMLTALIVGHTNLYRKLPEEILGQWLEFERVIGYIENKEHYTTDGFDRIVEIKESWNGGN